MQNLNEQKTMGTFMSAASYETTDKETGVKQHRTLIGVGATNEYTNDLGEKVKPNALGVLNKLNEAEILLRASGVDPKNMPVILNGDKDENGKAQTKMVARFFSQKYTDPQTAQVKFINKISISYGETKINEITGEREYPPSITATRTSRK